MRYDNDMKFTSFVILILCMVAFLLQVINIFILHNEFISIFMLGGKTFILVLSITLFVYNYKKIKELEKELFDDLMLEIKKRK